MSRTKGNIAHAIRQVGYRRQNDVFDKWKIDATQHTRLDVDGVVEEITQNDWNHVETRAFLDCQYFAVFTPR